MLFQRDITRAIEYRHAEEDAPATRRIPHPHQHQSPHDASAAAVTLLALRLLGHFDAAFL